MIAFYCFVQTKRYPDTARRAQNGLVGVALMIGVGSLLWGQNATHREEKPTPPTIESQIVVLPDSAVQKQWAHTLKLVNAPQGISRLNPGQCIRVGIYSTGEKRDDYLQKTKLSFRVKFAGHVDTYPLAPPSGFKQIKPEGLDFATHALAAGGVEMPESMKTMASLAASAERWCVAADAGDGSAILEAEVESPGGHEALSSATIEIESFETGGKRGFKNDAEFGTFLETYYRQPNPARLFPALQYMIAQEAEHSKEGRAEIVAAFLSAALGANPVAAKDFQGRVSSQTGISRALGLLVLRSAAYDISGVLNAMSEEEQKKILDFPPLEDPFDLAPTQALFQHLDMLWGVFGATGELKPVQTIASALNWRADYEDFDKLRKTPNHPSTLTPSIIRGVTYTAAGWSLSSFQRNDPLVADYIDYLLASPDASPLVRSELGGLSSNPAFKKAGGQ